MTYLPSLIKKIDDFCSLTDRLEKTAQDYSGGYSSPDEPEEESGDEEGGGNPPYYDELMNLSRGVDDPELSQQLQMLAELYRYAIQLGGGYSTIATAINNLKTMYGDGSDSDIEDTLNGMIKELAKAAGGIKALSGRDNPSFVQRLAQLKQDIEARNQEERSGALDAYQEEISGKGAGAQTEESQQDLAEAGLTPEQAEIVNPAALGFADKEDPKTNKGWHTTGSGKAYKNWKEYYNNERISYEADLVNETDPDVRQVLDQLIKLLPILSDRTEKALDLSNALRNDIANPAEEAAAKTKLAEMQQELQRIKYIRRGLRNKIRDIQLQKEQQKISAELQDASEKFQTAFDPERKERFRRETELLKQKLALNELAQSSDVYKAKERNYRLEMVRQMSGGAFPAQDWIEKQQQKISAAQELRKSKAAYDRTLTEQRAKEQGRQAPAERPAQRGGWGEGERHIDIEKGTNVPTYFPLLVGKVGPGINTAMAGVTYYIAREKEGGNAALHPFIQAVSAAIKKKDNAAKYAAINKLREETKKYILRKTEASAGVSAVASYEIAIRLVPYFRKIDERLKQIAGWQSEKGIWALDEQQKRFVVETAIYISRMSNIYTKQYKHRKSNFDSLALVLLPKIGQYLEENILGIVSAIKTAQTKEEKREYDRVRSVEKARQKGKTIEPAFRASQKGGWGEGEKRDQYDHDLATFFGLVDLLQDKINTGISYARLRLTRPKEGGDPALKPYVAAVSAAILKGDNAAKYEAVRALKAKISETIVSDQTLKVLLHSNRLLPFYYQIRDDLKTLSSLKDKKSGDWYLDEDAKQLMSKIIEKTQRLQVIRSKYYSPDQMRLYFDKPLDVLSDISNRLTKLIHYKPRITNYDQ